MRASPWFTLCRAGVHHAGNVLTADIDRPLRPVPDTFIRRRYRSELLHPSAVTAEFGGGKPHSRHRGGGHPWQHGLIAYWQTPEFAIKYGISYTNLDDVAVERNLSAIIACGCWHLTYPNPSCGQERAGPWRPAGDWIRNNFYIKIFFLRTQVAIHFANATLDVVDPRRERNGLEKYSRDAPSSLEPVTVVERTHRRA